jgi:eukaryotic-like serine/threonine-protein kinase
MVLTAGTQISSYEILASIGKGGMGEVYRAKDRKLGREVAIKVLPEEFAKDADHVARFQREAKLLASLNHPNIAAIYGLEVTGGTNFLVLELVEGETLADRIKAGPVPVEEALKLALQIAEALEAAHEKGVIHRDLKPANIKVTPEGKVKVLDFGLAKAFVGEQVNQHLSNSPTLSYMATQQGVILGTAAYMSPEQARGKPVDKRTDIWAFGCVLYEMLTGCAAFSGQDVTDILASVIRSAPDLSKLPANLHWRIREILQRCLEKEVRDRCSGISDARVEIQKALGDPGGVPVQPIMTVEPRRKLRTILPWAAAALVLGLIIAGVVVWTLKPSEPRRVTRLYCELPPGQQFSNIGQPCIAVSHDGRKLAYTTNKGIYLRKLDEQEARLIPGTADEAPMQPFFSYYDTQVGYWSQRDQKLKRIPAEGGEPSPITDICPTGSLSWGSDDTILYGQQVGGIIRVSAKSGTPEPIVEPTNKAEQFFHPRFLQNGASLIFTLGPPEYRNMVQSLKSGTRKELYPGHYAQYLSTTRQLIYVERNNLYAVPFDEDMLKPMGDPVSAVPDIFHLQFGAPQYDISSSGTLIYVPLMSTSSASSRMLVWVDRDGKKEEKFAGPAYYSSPRIFAAGKKVAMAGSYGGENINIIILDLVAAKPNNLTFGSGIDYLPVWSLQGERIFFYGWGKDRNGIFYKAANGTGKEKPLREGSIGPGCLSPDGKSLVAQEAQGGSGSSFYIGTLSLEGDNKWVPLLKEAKYSYSQPRISRDGNWIAYTSNKSGRNEVWVRPYQEVKGESEWKISEEGGNSPLWSPVSQELFYRNGDAVMAVSYKNEPGFKHETPKVVFRGAYVNAKLIWQPDGEFSPWDISPDGKRFLMIKELSANSSAEGPRRINIVLNWFEELKQKAPVK